MQREVRHPPPANDTLERNIRELLTRPVGGPSFKPVVRFKSFLYQAASWHADGRWWRRSGSNARELFPRIGFIVTNFRAASRAVVHFYNKRETAEQWTKEGKQGMASRRR